MGTLTALLLATPIFGFSLQAPLLEQAGALPAIEQSAELSAKTVADLRAADAAAADSEGSGSGGGGANAEYLQELKTRNNIASIHRAFGIATWSAMTLTVIAGFLAYNNLYGFGDSIANNPCVKGTAIGGDWGCAHIRDIKNSLAVVTTALYATTFTLSLMMPDPDKLSEGKGEFASRLRTHKTLRWVHLSGMVLQALFGVIIANGLFGLDRANNYGTLQALATAHMGIGLVTLGALTWAGALMVF